MRNYERVATRSIHELAAEAVVYRHKKSGARIFTVKNEDENRVFSIAFRTPAEDSTGVAHIMEHSVLCGSEKFPLKDPFVELAKGSLNTFLNAMTYPDKTVYPVASTNEKDFDNLMNVYMDAVLHPLCIRDERTFRQEGWHYELPSEGEELGLNGVVYNEMKGAFSNPESVLERYVLHSLFPDTSYANESGGDPEAIPALSFEAFREFHSRYYHPSNAYIILYGDLDMEKKLMWLDREYLCHYDSIDPDSELLRQKPFSRRRREEILYPVGENEPLENRTYLSLGTVLGKPLDAKRNMAFSVLDYALLSSPGAPLKQALLEAGIGEDIFGGFDDGILQPYFSVTAKNAEKTDEKRFVQLIRKTLERLVKDGLDKKTLLSAINHDEFQEREADYGRTPKGLVYSLSVLDSWIYGEEPWKYLENEKLYGELRSAVEEGYFETLIQEELLGNPHSSLLVLSPERGLTEKRAESLRKSLAERKAGLSPEERRALVRETAELKAYQDEPSPEEALLSLPMLSREDIGSQAEKYHYTLAEVGGRTLLLTELPSRGILYLRLNFNTAVLTEEELPYAALLKTVLGYMDTGAHSFQDLSAEIYLETGGISYDMTAYPNLQDSARYTGLFSVDLKLLYEKIGRGLSLAEEILHTTAFEDGKRMTEILNELRSREQMRAESASHSLAVNRASAGFSATARYQELCGGISFCRFVEAELKHYRKSPEKLTEKLRNVAEKLFRAENLFFSAGGEKTGIALLMQQLPNWLSHYEQNAREQAFLRDILEPEHGENPDASMEKAQLLLTGSRREAFRTASSVNYVARAGRFDAKKHPYTGALKVLKGILNYEYLWLNLRVKGGAYGCMSGFGRSGEGYLVSYRDPKLQETLAIYEALPEYLADFRCSERDLMKYIIGAISELDTPKTNYTKTLLTLSLYLSGMSNEMLQREREEILGTTVAQLQALSPYVKEILESGASCTIGNAAQIRDAAASFEKIEELFR